MTDFLYKVSSPKSNLTFHPKVFWRTEDWSSSSSRPRDGYIEDLVLYAGDFDEISMHLFPKIWRLRVRLEERVGAMLRELGYEWEEGSKALIFIKNEDAGEVENFCPTIFMFTREGFEPVPSNEYISRSPRTAVASETVSMAEAIMRWGIKIHFVSDAQALVSSLDDRGIEFSTQT